MLFGNIYVYISFTGNSEITNKLRLEVYGVLTAVGILGTIIMVFLPKPQNENSTSTAPGVLESFVQSVELFKTKRMAIISVTFFYTGIMQSFILGIYGTSVGNTRAFGSDSSKLIGISGMLIGLGEIVGGGLFGILPSITNKYGRDPVILLGFLCHIISLASAYINLPHKSSLEVSDLDGLITPVLPLALVTSFLLGLGDACFSTQIYSFLSTNYKTRSASAFALFKFTQSIASSICFLYSNSIDLTFHVPILIVGVIAGTFSFWYVEWSSNNVVNVTSSTESVTNVNGQTVDVTLHKNSSLSQLSQQTTSSYVATDSSMPDLVKKK